MRYHCCITIWISNFSLTPEIKVSSTLAEVHSDGWVTLDRTAILDTVCNYNIQEAEAECSFIFGSYLYDVQKVNLAQPTFHPDARFGPHLQRFTITEYSAERAEWMMDCCPDSPLAYATYYLRFNVLHQQNISC